MMSKSMSLANRVSSLSKIGNSARYFAKGKSVSEESNSNLNNVIGGYKATINNPNVSERAKEQAEGRLERLEENNSSDSTFARNQNNSDLQHPYSSNVSGGFKATSEYLYNNTRNEQNLNNMGQQQNRYNDQMLDNQNIAHDNADISEFRGAYAKDRGSNVNPHNVAGGYKATLSNAHTSEEAKARAEQKLHEMGENYTPRQTHNDFAAAPKSNLTEQQRRNMEISEQNLNNPQTGSYKRASTSTQESRGACAKSRDTNAVNVAGGFKATISNPRTSEEAKARAEQSLSEMGELPSRSGFQNLDTSRNNVDLNNSRVNMFSESDVSEFRGAYAKDKSGNVNPHNVAGGYKSTILNPNISEEAKARAEQMLSEMGESSYDRNTFRAKADLDRNSTGVNYNNQNMRGNRATSESSPSQNDEAMLTTAEQRARGSIPENKSGYTLGEDIAQQKLRASKDTHEQERSYRNNMEDAKNFANRKH